MPIKWTDDKNLTLLLLALGDCPKFTINANRIVAAWPDDPKPSARSVAHQFATLKKRIPGIQANIGGGSRKNSNTSTPVKANGVDGDHYEGVAASTSTTSTGSATPDTPFTTGKFRSALPPSNSNGTNVLNGTTISTISTNSTKVTNKKNLKRKASAISTSDNESSPVDHCTSSEDELATPTKTVPPPKHRSSLPRRSKSATPAYTMSDGEDGTGKDVAAVEIDSAEEYNGDEEGKMAGVKKGWRERGGGKVKGQDEED